MDVPPRPSQCVFRFRDETAHGPRQPRTEERSLVREGHRTDSKDTASLCSLAFCSDTQATCVVLPPFTLYFSLPFRCVSGCFAVSADPLCGTVRASGRITRRCAAATIACRPLVRSNPSFVRRLRKRIDAVAAALGTNTNLSCCPSCCVTRARLRVVHLFDFRGVG